MLRAVCATFWQTSSTGSAIFLHPFCVKLLFFLDLPTWAFSPHFRVRKEQKVTKFPRTDKSAPQYKAKLIPRQQTNNLQKYVLSNRQENQDMKPKARFVKSVIDAAASSQTAMPWARGARRAAFISSRAEIPARGLKTA